MGFEILFEGVNCLWFSELFGEVVPQPGCSRTERPPPHGFEIPPWGFEEAGCVCPDRDRRGEEFLEVGWGVAIYTLMGEEGDLEINPE